MPELQYIPYYFTISMALFTIYIFICGVLAGNMVSEIPEDMTKPERVLMAIVIFFWPLIITIGLVVYSIAKLCNSIKEKSNRKTKEKA